MIVTIRYIRQIDGAPEEYIYRQFQLHCQLIEKTTIKDGYDQEYVYEEPEYNVENGSFDIQQDSIEEAEISTYEAIGWIYYEPPEE